MKVLKNQDNLYLFSFPWFPVSSSWGVDYVWNCEWESLDRRNGASKKKEKKQQQKGKTKKEKVIEVTGL